MKPLQSALVLALALLVQLLLAFRFMSSPSPHVALGAVLGGGLLGIVIARRYAKSSVRGNVDSPQKRNKQKFVLVGSFVGLFLILTNFVAEPLSKMRFPGWVAAMGEYSSQGIWLALLTMTLTCLSGVLFALWKT